MTLPLYGTATLCKGFEKDTSRVVARLKALGTGPSTDDHDFYIVRSQADLARAIEEQCNSIFVIDDDAGVSLSMAHPNIRAIAVPTKFSYLDAGDILGIHNNSRKFRSLISGDRAMQ
jgi:hypothetical protein